MRERTGRSMKELREALERADEAEIEKLSTRDRTEIMLLEELKWLLNPWVVQTVAAGVIGNAAYEALKLAVLKTRTRMRGRREPTAREVVEAAAILATVERCRQLGIAAPPADQMHAYMDFDQTYCSVTLCTRGHRRERGFNAEVKLPLANLAGDRIEVRLWWTISDDDERERRKQAEADLQTLVERLRRSAGYLDEE